MRRVKKPSLHFSSWRKFANRRLGVVTRVWSRDMEVISRRVVASAVAVPGRGIVAARHDRPKSFICLSDLWEQSPGPCNEVARGAEQSPSGECGIQACWLAWLRCVLSDVRDLVTRDSFVPASHSPAVILKKLHFRNYVHFLGLQPSMARTVLRCPIHPFIHFLRSFRLHESCSSFISVFLSGEWWFYPFVDQTLCLIKLENFNHLLELSMKWIDQWPPWTLLQKYIKLKLCARVQTNDGMTCQMYWNMDGFVDDSAGNE